MGHHGHPAPLPGSHPGSSLLTGIGGGQENGAQGQDLPVTTPQTIFKAT